MEILCVSDVHLKIENVKVVSEWIKSNKKNPDLIFCSGDIANLKGKDYEDEVEKNKSIDAVYDILMELEKICSKVYFIPGNHDALDFFKEDFQFDKPSNSVNIHSKVGKNNYFNTKVKLNTNLYLGGFGGATPGYWKTTGEKAWEGYPYNNEVEYSKSFQNLDIKSIMKNENSIILMSHLGPSSSQTTIYFKDYTSPKIMSGSDLLNEFLLSEDSVSSFWVTNILKQKSIFLNVHGHTHPGYGRTSLGNVQTINPGSLKENRFGYLKIEQLKNGKWFLASSEQVEFE